MFIMAIIPDVPEEIEIQLQRTEFITKKLIDRVSDDNDEDVVGTDDEVPFQTYPDEGGKFTSERNIFMKNMT